MLSVWLTTEWKLKNKMTEKYVDLANELKMQ